MNEPQPEADSLDRPVAYDAEGRPLYARPAEPSRQSNDQIPVTEPAYTTVHVARLLDPVPVEIPPEVQAKHDQSEKMYPQLDLSEHEYVVLNVHRHLIGLAAPLAVTLTLLVLIISAMVLLPQITQGFSLSAVAYGTILLLCMLTSILLAIGMYVLYWVYTNNTFFLTNESIIEKIQLSLFSSNVKSVGLGDVVDVSYQQAGLIQELFAYGTVQVGTKDDEVPCVFHTVRNPKQQASILKEAVEAFKNGRPLDDLV